MLIGIACVFLTVGCNKTTDTKVPEQLPFDTAVGIVSHRHLIHLELRKHNLTKESEWDSLNNIKILKARKHIFKRHPEYKVYGWHMYSEGSAYKNYNFSILAGVIYFAYEMNPNTGAYNKIHAWETTSLVDSAKAHNCNVFLSVTNFGEKDNHTFLTSSYAQKNFLETVSKLLKARDANGVVLDFENIGGKDRDNFSAFVKDFSTKLKKINPSYQLIVSLYAKDYRNVFDIKAIDPYIDEYILMGYDYYGSFSTETGPVAPLYDLKKGLNYSISTSVRDYLNEGVAVSKLILGLPYYGAEWSANSTSIPSKVKDFISHPSYSQTKTRIIKNNIIPDLDNKAVTKYLISNKENTIYQTWYDDSLTLAHKYDWVLEQDLAGVAPWTLSYSGQYKSLWNLLNAKFGQTDNTQSASDVSDKSSKKRNEEKTLSRHQTKNYFSHAGNYAKNILPNYKPWSFKKSSFFDEKKKESHLIYGFYPFWNDNKKLKIDFRLYSRIAYFAALPDPENGKIKNAFGWSKLDVPLAQKHGCKVDLVVANYADQSESKVLKNKKNLDTLVQDLLQLFSSKEADGITIDFGSFPKSDSENFNYLVKQLKEALVKIDTAYKLNCMLPQVLARNKKGAYDFSILNSYIDYYLITGFDYYGSHSKQAGPNAPLNSGEKWGKHSISNSIADYISQDLDKEKLVLIVPYFGIRWQTETENIPSKVKGRPQYFSYSDFKKSIVSGSKKTFDKESSTPCYKQITENKNYQTWIDDSSSLALKYDFVIKNNLAGIGIWSVGYDAGFHELDKLIAAKFYTIKRSGHTTKKKDMFFKELMNELRENPTIMILFWADLLLVFLLLNFILLSFRICFFYSLIRRYIYFFYALGFVLFIGTYFLLREIPSIPDDGTIAVALFIGLVCLILVKSILDSKAKKAAP